MKRSQLFIPVFVLFGILALTACNLPINQTPTEIVFPTPNLTMTAIFNPPVIVQPTVTPPEPSVQPTEKVAEPTKAATPIPPTPTAKPIVPTSTTASTTAPTPERASWTVPYLSTAPKIDGVWNEWNTTQFPMRFVVFGASNWTGKSDLDGAFRIGWDNNNLYIAAKITDDKYVQNATGENIYKGDSLELLLDTNLSGDASTVSLTNDDYQLGISAGKGEVGKNPEAYRWFPSDKAGPQTSVKIAAVPMSDGYRVEAAIPWSVLGVTPSNGLEMGFALSVSDNDKTSENVQQTMVSAIPDRVLTDPTTWGTITLKK